MTTEALAGVFRSLRLYHGPDARRAAMDKLYSEFLKPGDLAFDVGAHAGEIIQMWSLALSQGLNIKAMTGWISPYPTLSEINKRVSFRYYATAASNPIVRKVIAWLAKFG